MRISFFFFLNFVLKRWRWVSLFRRCCCVDSPFVRWIGYCSKWTPQNLNWTQSFSQIFLFFFYFRTEYANDKLCNCWHCTRFPTEKKHWFPSLFSCIRPQYFATHFKHACESQPSRTNSCSKFIGNITKQHASVHNFGDYFRLGVESLQHKFMGMIANARRRRKKSSLIENCARNGF